MNYRHILAIDPSGSFEEGKGTTGICYFNCVQNKVIKSFSLRAEKFYAKELYWKEHQHVIQEYYKKDPNMIVVIEEYMLDPNRAMQQSYSKMETSKLIGILQAYCYERGIPYKMQRAAAVKRRWSDKILVYKKHLERVKHHYYLTDKAVLVNEHNRDAIRHAVHYYSFANQKEDTDATVRSN